MVYTMKPHLYFTMLHGVCAEICVDRLDTVVRCPSLSATDDVFRMLVYEVGILFLDRNLTAGLGRVQRVNNIPIYKEEHSHI